jgi:uncharacterized protein (DUF983 family)
VSIDRRRGKWVEQADIRRWNLPESPALRLSTLLGRAVSRRCPYCGARGIFTNYWALHVQCPRCGVVFEREDGYFLGAYAINLIAAEFLGFGGILILLVWTELSTLALQMIAVVVAIGLPVLAYPFTRSLWMALDLMIHHPEKQPRG